ncbi:acetate kinase [Alpinimonas psychrophila]|uniref:Acetate kinase n=1 Tax=Alpinimonas psychrophila TaxID=748908 RepID=A0A7W3JV12_9MICO|nr:acetate kinase [Alpinimonas psychrophila]MBA8829739.1 acetate kinase [Alpinimonas psychrophila]
MKPILVVNSGSSSLKYQLIDMVTEEVLAHGLLERVSDHGVAFAQMLKEIAAGEPRLEGISPVAVGHRVVHGGTAFSQATVVTDQVLTQIHELASLAPLHNPGNLAGIEAAIAAFPDVPHVAVFDTAFHQSLAPASYTYAIDTAVASKHHIRRYGFHGTSHSYVASRTAEFLGRDLADLKIIVLHLGNGASACAIDCGRSIETSMGMTPLEGLVMGSRSGDLDPAILMYLSRVADYTPDQLDLLLNRESGLVGLTGLNDMRDVSLAATAGDPRSTLALEIYAHRIRHYVGAYFALLGGLDAVVFTAGVGENSADVRARVIVPLAHLGLTLDESRNAVSGGGARKISGEGAAVSVLVIPTNEELEIARQLLDVLEA